MADDTIPIDGSNGTRHLLKRLAGVGGVPVPDTGAGLHIIYGLSLLALGACVPSEQTDPDVPRTPVALTENAVALLADAEHWTPERPSWPADLAEHPQAPLESREWFVLLADTDGDAVHALQQRFTRIALAGESSHHPASASEPASNWMFDSVMQAAGRWSRDVGRSSLWQNTEREAAGLARTFQNDFTLPLSAHVLGQRATFSTAVPSLREISTSTVSVCAGSWTLNVSPHAHVTMNTHACPEDFLTETSVITRTAPLLVSGERYEDNAPIPVSGVAWMRHSWGRIDSSTSAVVLDSMVLTLRGIGTVDVIKTRRRSGQGAAVVTASLEAIEFNDVSWSTTGSCDTAATCTSQLTIPDLHLDVAVRPLVNVDAKVDATVSTRDEATGDVSGDLDGRLRRLVLASGTHRGGGYIDLESNKR